MYVNCFSSKNENGGLKSRRKAKKAERLNGGPTGGSKVVVAELLIVVAVAVLEAISHI